MDNDKLNELLNRLLVAHNRSLPAYLHSAVPWWQQRERPATAVLAQIVGDQQETVRRLGATVVENDGRALLGEFPLAFTALHDLSGAFLLPRLVAEQQQLVRLIEEAVPQLGDEPGAQSLAQEALGTAKAHLDMLQEIGRDPGGAGL